MRGRVMIRNIPKNIYFIYLSDKIQYFKQYLFNLYEEQNNMQYLFFLCDNISFTFMQYFKQHLFYLYVEQESAILSMISILFIKDILFIKGTNTNYQI